MNVYTNPVFFFLNRPVFIKSAYVIVLLFVSCSGSEYEKSFQIADNKWHSDNLLQFNFNIDNLYDKFDILINVRNTTDYEYSNIFMFVYFLYPDNTEVVDTVEGIMSDSRGRWLGTGSGRYRNNKFFYKKDINFPMTGDYVVVIEQAMRDKSLDGITTIGLEVVKTNKK